MSVFELYAPLAVRFKTAAGTVKLTSSVGDSAFCNSPFVIVAIPARTRSERRTPEDAISLTVLDTSLIHVCSVGSSTVGVAAVSVFVLAFAKGRHILAFTTQQTMPVAKESIDEMAPTIGNAAGEIAKGVTKGIKNGLEDENDDNYRS